MRRYLFVAPAVAALGCGGASGDAPPGEPETLLEDPLGALPEDFSNVGLYVGPPSDRAVAPAARAYAPKWELYSNGLAKDRYVVVPKGSTVDTSNRASWDFPVGTLAFKTFFADGPGGGRQPVETRLIRRAPEGWEYAVYLWDEAGAGATLADITTTKKRTVTIDGEEVVHEVPARLDCRQCHESNGTVLIGVDELGLGSPLEGAAETQLEAMAAAGLFSDPLPADPVVISDPDPLTLSVKGYMHANCAFCHNGGKGPATAFDMRHPVFVATTMNKPTEGSASAAGIRIVPGSPEESILFLAFSGETDDPEVKPMPPVGVQRRDAAAVEMLRAWIKSL